MHLSASIGAGKAPMDATLMGIALARQGDNVLPQVIEALGALGQTTALKNADLDLRHIQPGFHAWACNAPPGEARSAALPAEETPCRGWPPYAYWTDY
jgi:hypothetical protein